MIKVRRALISVSDKTGLVEFARGLQNFGVEIISTGGTAKTLKNAGINVREVSDYTGFPEILDGRVKTLHPIIHGGLLALREKAEHISQLQEHHIGLIDMVVVNLYPFEKTITRKNVSLEEAIENMDIGGPAMLRSAAKNFKNVAVLCNPERYKEILNELDVNSGILSDKILTSLAIEVFQLTSRYDSAIYSFLSNRLKGVDFSSFPKDLTLSFKKIQDLRYGENPHQAAALYRMGEGEQGLAKIKQLHGKELSFNNILDLNAAVDCVRGFGRPAAVIIKHNNPTGVAVADTLKAAYQQAFACDKLSAFGGIIGINQKLDAETAVAINKSGFMECVIAPAYDPQAIKILSQKKNFRIIELDFAEIRKDDFDFKYVHGGLLYQEADEKNITEKDLKVVSKLKPTRIQIQTMLFAWSVIKNVKSNAIVLAKGTKTVGIGCGLTSRVDSALVAIRKAGRNAQGSVLASEAFIPKTDTIKIAAKAGIKAIIQTGGSIADADVLREADKSKLIMVTTGIRHFKH